MKTLIFTDSRGQIKDSFSGRLLFTEKIKREFDCDLILCPYKWSTTLDFISLIESKKINIDLYDKIVLYTGVVEFSPRPLSNWEQAISDKLPFLHSFLGDYLDLKETYNVIYQGEDTKSIITTKAYEEVVIPYLQQLGDKLILINTNRIVPNWEGNYTNINPNGRPTNINKVAVYSEKTVGKFNNLINLLEWSDEDIRKYTVDNMHLTYAGSEYIYNKLIQYLK